jgi:hypothetical protein
MHSPIAPAAPDPSLTSVQRETLNALLNMIVPRTADGRMPGAAEMPELVRHLAEAFPALRELLDKLDCDARARYSAAFAALDEARRVSLLEEVRARNPKALDQLALETVTGYYQQDRVLEGLGLEARPPYPKGYQVEPGDLSLLNPVIARGTIYRDIS